MKWQKSEISYFFPHREEEKNLSFTTDNLPCHVSLYPDRHGFDLGSLSSLQGGPVEREWRVDKFIVKSNITSNKLQGFETVSRGSRHRSNHTQKIIPSVVAGHQFLQFGCIGQDTGLFPTTVIVIHLGFSLKTNQFTFQQTLSSPNCIFRICCLPLASDLC